MTSGALSLPPSARRIYRPAMLGAALGLLVIPAMRLAFAVQTGQGLLGVDYRLYTDAARRWLAGGPYLDPSQIASPHLLRAGDILYPPVILWLLVPFTVLPAVLWWAVPVSLLGWALWRLRPAPWAWPVMALLLTFPGWTDAYWLGQPTIWLPTLLALGLVRGGWAALVLLKPSLLPFALAGMSRRSWWLTVGALGLLSLPFGLMWLDWARAVMASGGGPLYSLEQVPLMLVPVVAWAARSGAARGARPSGR